VTMAKAVSPATAAVAKPRHLHDAVNAYRAAHKDILDKPALDLLNRLARKAAEAFELLNLRDQRDEAAILQTCIQADQLALTFPQRIKKAKETLSKQQVERLDRAVATLRKFVERLVAKEKEAPAFDWLSPAIPAGDIGAMNKGLYFIARRMEEDRRLANEDLLRLGATRKKSQTANKQNAATGWLAEGVRRVTGEEHLEAVRKIAEVILKTELSRHRVRHAARLRNREWRQP
jgi:hypothetical protein